ncbi:sigma-70 family RNA polymerase sigma factor [Lipingzhangella sp. LS1_29]|uniref:RNA polymerase sigma factor n=1 Tax=Lipingzhangella rawalii TaxID=2055835 RepID=A0ABU2H6G4_9ACTN|nr:sigma-70 family RNA polymerase sigma factor [Lipingzhangella rawalii]MDS1270899.1 sigma-70 family RNA polymerase sigma factor [Lipingzhangella rawalii]
MHSETNMGNRSRAGAAAPHHRPDRRRAGPSGHDDPTTTALALAAGDGDLRAAESFVQATRADVRRFIASRTPDRMVDDLTQDTFLRALSGIRGFQGRCPARSWLLAIARRVVADHYRCRGQEPVASEVDVASGVTLDEECTLRELVDGLAPERRQAFQLTRVLGYTYAEAASVLRCPMGTVRSRVARARSDLADAIVGSDRADG